MMSRTTRSRGLWPSLWPIFTGLLFLVAFYAVGDRFYNGYLLDLGSIDWPTPAYARFLSLWSVFGTAAAGFLALGLARLVRRESVSSMSDSVEQGPIEVPIAPPANGIRRLRDNKSAESRLSGESTSMDFVRRSQGIPFPGDSGCSNFLCDGQWVLLGSLAALLIPLALRIFLLDGAPLTDDESAYRFMAELLARGRLRAASPPLKLFFDREFMINDGHLYSQYFLGHPALMVPGVWLGHPEVMNAVYCALTVPALFLVARRLAGSFWAKIGMGLYLSSPMLMIGAATEMAHTSCLAALAWMTWFSFRSQDSDAPWWSHAGVAVFFGAMFFNRPIAALGMGSPLLLWWALRLRPLRGRQLIVSAAAFLAPALLMGGLFLAVNKVQNGSFTTTSYQRMHAYMKENGYRFSGWQNEAQVNASLRRAIAAVPVQAGIVFLRLNCDLFGWPSAFVFAFFAGLRRRAGLLWLSLLTFVLVHLLVLPFDSGIDSFGPVHYAEAAWPIVLLTVLGLRAASGCQPAPQSFPLSLVFALVLVAWFGFVPVRFGTLARIAASINLPRETVRRAGIHHAVIFAPRPFVQECASAPTKHFLFWWPNNDPDLTNDVLWANHINVEQDRRLMEHFPGRSGYVMAWARPCSVRVLPLASLEPGAVPDGLIGGTGEGPS